MSSWSSDAARQAYNIPHWSDGYVDVSASGDVLVRPGRDHAISLPELASHLRREGLALPVLVRFRGILHDRVNRLCQSFNQAAQELDYQGRFTAVYPIKVNQQRRVVEEILAAQPAASQGQIGLEAGSKPELMVVLAMAPANSTIVCNGYKDREFIRLALIGQGMGHRVFIVVEKLSELSLILEESRDLGIRPLIGLRARLASIGKGNWQNTGGEKSKFGLSSAQILTVVEKLTQENSLDCLQLLHFHLGSQIANIRDIQTGLRECARFFTELRRAGAGIETVDVGGGLGVDYEGTRSRSACSMNYSLHEYAYQVLRVFREACEQTGQSHPNVITESGRAITAHHAVLITDVIDAERANPQSGMNAPDDDDKAVLHELWRDLQSLEEPGAPRSLLELYEDASHALQEAQSQFIHGVLSLSERARAEQLYQAVCHGVRKQLDPGLRIHRETFDELNEKLADKVFVNFSLFQSLPDIWGIDQVFPILPLSGLDQPPTRRAVLQDITCDSDGRIDQYVDGSGLEPTLPLPEPPSDGPQLLGFFLTGAYQEILGDMHNLFGDTDAVDVWTDEKGGIHTAHAQSGDTVDKVLRYVSYDTEWLLRQFRVKIAESALPEQRKRSCLEELVAGLSGYTYFES